jgi:hypothetical protein
MQIYYCKTKLLSNYTLYIILYFPILPNYIIILLFLEIPSFSETFTNFQCLCDCPSFTYRIHLLVSNMFQPHTTIIYTI